MTQTKIVLLLSFSFLGLSCSQSENKPAPIENKHQMNFERNPSRPDVRDGHGCVTSAGYVWSAAKDSCIRLWESATELVATNRSEFVLFAVESYDKMKAEIFVPGDTSLLLQGTGNGTYTNDSMTLIVHGNNYVLKEGGRTTYQSGAATAPAPEQKAAKHKKRRR